MRTCIVFALGACLLLPRPAASANNLGEPPPAVMSLSEAVRYALAHEPTIRAQAALEERASDETDAARWRLIPRGDISAQENRATGNVVPGAEFAMPGLPQIAGPPTDRVFDSGVWGSAAAFTTSWDVAHLAAQMDRVDAALARQAGARAASAAAALAVAFGAADAFAAAVASSAEVKAAQAEVERGRTLQSTVGALVRSGLRPGADAARADAELALAQTDLIRAEQAEAVAGARLARAIGAAGHPARTRAGKLLDLAPREGRATASTGNPLIAQARHTRAAARALSDAERLEYIPRVALAAALWGRGSGLFPGGAKLGFGQGLAPDTPNWAAGIVVDIPILQYPEIRARVDAERANLRLSLARYDEVVQDVQTQVDTANAILESAYRIADNTRVSADASRTALDQASARYKAGLYTIDAVAEALRLLARAEADDAVARVAIWRAKLFAARAVGDLSSLLAQTDEASGR